jgi:prophage regulatory protein
MYASIQRLTVVKVRTGLSRSTIYLRIAQGRFPRPVRLGKRAVGWLESDISTWILSLQRSEHFGEEL